MMWLLFFFGVLLCIDYAVLRNAENIFLASIGNIPYDVKKDLSQINGDKFKGNDSKQDNLFSANEDEDEDWDDIDDLVDKEEFDFLLIGIIATVLFLLVGFFTGNTIYFYLMIFIISAIVYINGRNS